LTANGVLYPEILPASALRPSVNHQEFGETLDGRRRPRERKACLEKLSRELATTDADVVILSYEDFALQQRRFGVPQTLRTVFEQNGFRMEVAVVVKAPSEYLNSTYSHRAQLVREERTFRQFARAAWDSRRFDYHALLQPWLAEAEGRISAIPFRDRRSSARLLRRIISGLALQDRIGHILPEGEGGSVENRSPGAVAVEASRRLRRIRAREQVKVPPREIGRFLDQRAWSRGWDKASFRGNDPEMLAHVDRHFAAANDRLAKLAWNAPWGEVYKNLERWDADELGSRPISAENEERVALLFSEAMSHFDIRYLPRVWCAPANLAEDAIARLARLVGYTGWRVD
jgi:hypothetical protein